MDNKQKKFVITPKVERSVTLTVRLETELNNYIEEFAKKVVVPEMSLLTRL